MTADQIIHEIEALSVEDQERVIWFAYRLGAERRLTGQELTSLAERMASAKEPAEAMILREAIVQGFYGGKPHA